LNPEWFLSDDVPMLSPTAEYDSKVQDTPRSVRGSVPLFDIHRVPDLASLFRYTVENRGKIGRKRLHPGRMTVLERIFEPVGFISIPGVNGCDGGLTIAGDGMAPAIRSGDVVIYRQLDSVSEILWGEMYLLSIDVPSGEYVAVRYLHRSENPGSAIMTGENRAFADTEIALSDITAIALVKASVRMNSAK
jgi:hypothetical protein